MPLGTACRKDVPFLISIYFLQFEEMRFVVVAVQLLLVLSTTTLSVVVEGFGAHRPVVMRPPNLRDTTLWASKKKKPLTPAQRVRQQISEDDNVSDFDKVKKALYGGVDSLQDLSLSKPKKTSIKGGYSEIEREALEKKKANPLRKLAAPPAPAPPPSASQPAPSRSIFDSVKGVLYKTVDKAQKLASSPDPEEAPNKNPDAPSTADTDRELRDKFPDLKSENPLKRARAEFELKIAIAKDNARKAELARQETLRRVKEGVYKVGDTIQDTAERIAELPEKMGKGYKTTINVVRTIPGTVQGKVQEIQAIPRKVKQTAEDVQESVTSTVQKSKQAVADVKAFPSRVQQTARETKEGFDSLKENVEELVTNLRVFFGLEEAKPRPPKTKPPSPPTPAAAVLEIVGTILFGAGRLLMWMGQQLAGTALSSLKKSPKVASTTASETTEAKSKVATGSQEESATKAAADSIVSKTQETKPPVSYDKPIKLDDENLDRQIQEALDLAEEALNTAKSRKKKD